MGQITTVRYRLPGTELVVTGTVRRTRDAVFDDGALEDAPAKLVNYSVELRHVADGPDREVEMETGLLLSYKGSLAFTQDRRLTAASVESTGEGATILSTVASIAGSVIGLRSNLMLRAAGPAATVEKSQPRGFLQLPSNVSKPRTLPRIPMRRSVVRT